MNFEKRIIQLLQLWQRGHIESIQLPVPFDQPHNQLITASNEIKKKLQTYIHSATTYIGKIQMWISNETVNQKKAE